LGGREGGKPAEREKKETAKELVIFAWGFAKRGKEGQYGGKKKRTRGVRARDRQVPQGSWDPGRPGEACLTREIQKKKDESPGHTAKVYKSQRRKRISVKGEKEGVRNGGKARALDEK